MSVVTWYAEFAYHEEDAWAGLLAGELHTVAAEAQRRGCDVRITREWQRGPHLRLGIRGEADAAAEARARADAVIASIIRDRPARVTVTLEQLRENAESMARAAGVALRSDWLANNTVTWTGPTPAAPAHDLDSLVEDFHFATTPAALRMLAAGGGEQQLVLRDVELMAATAQRYSRGGLLAASTSFRSHAEAYLALQAPAGTRSAWDDAARRSGPALREHLFALARGEITPPHVSEWLAALEPVMATARELQSAGAVALPTVAAGFSPELTERSEFHRAVSGNDAWSELLASDWFALYRLALNLLYLQLSRLGVRPVARYRLCHLVASSLQGGAAALVPSPNPEESTR